MNWAQIKEQARELRKNQTEAESALWHFLRNRRMNGFKFFRQHPLVYEINQKKGYFIADFYSKEGKIVIELDGAVHEFNKVYDSQRDIIISQLGLRVIRFKNEEIERIENVLAKINEILILP